MRRPDRLSRRVALLIAVSVAMALPLSGQVLSFEDVNPDSSTLDSTDPDGATGGRVNGIAIDPNSPLVMYAASEWGGVYKSTDGGDTWAKLDGHRPVAAWDVEVDPSNSNRIYATSFSDGRSPSLSGINVSTDGGATWTQPATAVPPTGTCANAFDQTELSAFGISISPANNANVFIGTSCGLAISLDSGATWFFNYHPSFSRKRVWDVVAAADGLRVDMCGDDGHLAVDSSGNWQSPSLGFPLPSGICSIAASPFAYFGLHNRNLFATVGMKFYETTAADGFNWVETRFNPNSQGRIPFVETNLRSGTNTFDVWFGDVSLHRVTCDAGAVLAKCGAGNVPPPGNTPPWVGPFTRSAGGHDDMGAIAFDPTVATDACPRLMSSDGGVYRNTKTTSPNCHNPFWEQPTVSPHGLWPWTLSGADRAGGDVEDLYFGNQDTGVFGAIDAGATNPSWENDMCCDGFDAAADSFGTGSIIYSGCCFGGGVGRSTLFFKKGAGFAGGGEINYPTGGLPQGFRPTDAIARWDDRKYVMVTHDCTVGQLGCPGADGGVFVTQNADATPIVWTEIGNATEPPSASICGVKVGTTAGVPTFYVQTGDCGANSATDRMFRFTGTNPNGAWTEITLPQGGFGIFAVNKNDPQRLLASGFTANDAFMYKSTNSGTSWTSLPGLDTLMRGGGDFPIKNQRGPGGPGGTGSSHMTGYRQPSLVALDPNDPDVMLAGGRDSGIFLSTDGGDNWTLETDPRTSHTSGTPHIPRPWHAYFDSEPDGSKAAYVSSQGRGVWRLKLSESSCDTDLVLADHTVSGSESFAAANSITTGPAFVVQSGASATLTAGGSITMLNGTTLAGDVTVSISPSPCSGFGP